MFDVNDLLLYVKVVEIGSFLHTARLLNVSHPTIARKIKNLETYLDATLLIVSTKGFEVTDIGKQIYNLIKEQAITVDDLINKLELIAKAENEPRGKLKIALPMVISMNLISPYLPDFLIKYPHIDMIVRYQNQEIDLVKGGYDLAILNYIPNQLNLKIKHVLTIMMKLYCTKAYAQKYGVPKTPEELANHLVTGYMLVDETIPHQIPLINTKTGINTVINMPQRFVINNALHSLKFMFSNEVICAMYDDLDPILKTDAVIPVLPEYHSQVVKYYMVRHPHSNDLKTNLCAKFLEECLQSTASG